MARPVVLITGALTGIGRATAVEFAKEGAQIAVSGRHPDKGEALVRQLREGGSVQGGVYQSRRPQRGGGRGTR
jgi:NAD(P)-dependent dehydrogenase (short-subunit alcohol dehydrogenase family)